MIDSPRHLPPSVTRRPFGKTAEAESVELFTLANGRGCEVQIATYGATVTALRVPDARGEIDDVVLGFDSLEGYLGAHPYFGGTIGRFANRIARGRFHLDGREYMLACNNGMNHLHGGLRGFDRRAWSATSEVMGGASIVRMERTSSDGEEGYPGTLKCQVVYSLNDANELQIDYTANSDRPTVVNLTHHSYFNLAGRLSDDILGHRLQVWADKFLPVDPTQIPTGERLSVAGTAFDFRRSKSLGPSMNADARLETAHGFDHNFILNRVSSMRSEPQLAARLIEPLSGRVMEVLTSQPGLQVYAGGFLDGTIIGKSGRPYRRHAALCLEAQQFPDAPNRPEFPSTRLLPGETYRSSTIYRFLTDAAPHDWNAAS